MASVTGLEFGISISLSIVSGLVLYHFFSTLTRINKVQNFPKKSASYKVMFGVFFLAFMTKAIFNGIYLAVLLSRQNQKYDTDF